VDAEQPWLPSGLVLPCRMGGELWYVRGSRKRGVLYGADWLGDRRDVIICEGKHRRRERPGLTDGSAEW